MARLQIDNEHGGGRNSDSDTEIPFPTFSPQRDFRESGESFVLEDTILCPAPLLTSRFPSFSLGPVALDLSFPTASSGADDVCDTAATKDHKLCGTHTSF
jgi:hypothetical protein